MMTGDLLWELENPDPEQTLIQLYDVLNQTKIPVVITYGNHDAEGDFSRQQLREFEDHLKYLADKHDSYTIFDRQNYVLDIYCEDQVAISYMSLIVVIMVSGKLPANMR